MKSSRLGWTAVALSLLSIGATQLLGPNAAEPPLPGHAWLIRLHAGPPDWLIVLLLAVAAVAGGVAVWLGLSGRWSPDPKKLLAVGMLATVLYAVMPPVGSADPLSYASYGHMAATGHNPWTTTPAQRAAAGDPVAKAVEPPWQHTPSVYGPLAAGEQDLASRLAGTDVAATVEILDCCGALLVMLGGWALWWAAGTESRRRRTVLLFSANPLLLGQVVAGGHVDALVGGFAAIGIALAMKSKAMPAAVAAGIATGLATDIKAPAALVAIALAWSARHDVRRLAGFAGGALVVSIPAYLASGLPAIRQLRRASRLISAGTPWRIVHDVTGSRTVVGVLALLLLAVLIVAFGRITPDRHPAALATILVVAYVLAAPYALAWYDGLAYAAVALAAASAVDRLAITHTAVLALAYIPGRAAVTLAEPLRGITDTMRAGVSPVVIFLLIVTTGVLAVSYHRGVRSTSSGTSESAESC